MTGEKKGMRPAVGQRRGISLEINIHISLKAYTAGTRGERARGEKEKEHAQLVATLRARK